MLIVQRYKLWYPILATANACFGFLFYSYNITIFGALLPFIKNYLFPEQTEFVNTLIASCPILSAIIGALIAGYFCLRIGRRKTMILFDFIAIGGVVVSLFDVLACLFVGRLLLGFTIGVTSVAAPLYFSEISPVVYRGEFTNGPPIFGAFGILFATLLGLLVPAELAPGETDGTWRVLLALAMIPLILRIFNFLVFFRCETPFYYVNKAKYAKAAKGLRKTMNADADVAERIVELMKERDYVKTEGAVRFLEVFKKRFRFATFVCAVMLSLQYLSGLNIILVFSGQVYSSGLTNDRNLPYILSVCTVFVNFLGAIVSMWTCSQFGRKPLLVGGVIGCGVLFLIYGILAKAVSEDSLVAKIWLVFWPFPWNLSVGSVMYIIVAETLPDVGVSVASFWNWVFAFLTLQFFPKTEEAIGYGWTFIMYGIITVVGALFLWLTVVETKDKNKDDILMLYSGKTVPARPESLRKQQSYIAAQAQTGPAIDLDALKDEKYKEIVNKDLEKAGSQRQPSTPETNQSPPNHEVICQA